MLALTDLIQLDNVRLDAQLGKQRLGRLAVRAPGFGEDGDGVLVDDALRLRLGCHSVLRAGGVALEDVASARQNPGLVGWELLSVAGWGEGRECTPYRKFICWGRVTSGMGDDLDARVKISAVASLRGLYTGRAEVQMQVRVDCKARVGLAL